MRISEMAARAYANSKAHGFHEDTVDIPEKLVLIHSEVSEALEDYREDNLRTVYRQGEAVYTEPGPGRKPCGLPSELADIVIRVGDLAAALGIDLESEIIIKMQFNEGRPPKHGKRC